jgi:hypothetical protein
MGSILGGLLGGLSGEKKDIPTEELKTANGTPTNWVAIGAMVTLLAVVIFLVIKLKK